MRPRGLNPTPLAGAEPPLVVDDDVAVASLETPVGRLGVVVSPVGVSAVGWRDPRELTGGRPIIRDEKRLSSVIEQLTAYFHGELRQFTVELDLRGATATQRLVLRTLHDTVAYGSSVTYGQLAHRSRTGVPARGIGSMLAANPIPIVVPCHRVLARTGLGGYSGGRTGEGLPTKRWLLTLEGVLQPPLGWVAPKVDRAEREAVHSDPLPMTAARDSEVRS